MKLKEITISGFRGFNRKQTVNLDHSLIIIKGSNGSGKSSLVEAIEWLFFDEISRWRKSLCRSEYSGEFLRNIHSSKEQETFVELCTEVGGQVKIIKKSLISPEKKEYFMNGSAIVDFSCLGISFADVYKPILSQVEVKHYVETDPKDRYEETNKILGLGILSELRNDLQDLQKSKKTESKYQTAKKFYNGLESDLKEIDLANLWLALEKRPFSAQMFESQLMKIIAQTYSIEPRPFGQLSMLLDDNISKLAQKSDSTIGTVLAIPDKDFISIPKKITDEIRQLFNLLKDLRPMTADLHSFLETGKNLISDSICPFCQERTINLEKRKEIEERILATKEADILLSNVNSKKSSIQQLKNDYYQRSMSILNTDGIDKISKKISVKPYYDEEKIKIESLKIEVESLKTVVASFNLELNSLIQQIEGILKGTFKLDKEKNSIELDQADEDSKLIQEKMEKLSQDLPALLSAIVSKSPSLSDQEKQELKRYITIRKIIDHLDDVKFVGIFENNIEIVSKLIEEIEKFEKLKSEKQISNLNSSIKAFYERLNPDEKTQFAEILSKGKTRKIQIKAVSHGKEMNPVSCFSEAHMNCLCLSIYFSQRVLNNPYWDFVVLDDPVQSMDEDHSKNLIRIVDEVHAKKQVIITTHNARFCQDFKELFYGRDYLFYEFSGNEIDGPNIDLKQAPFKTHISVARKYANGNTEERETSGNHLRKAIERFTADMLIQKGKLSHKRSTEMKLEERLEKLEVNKLLEVTAVGEIKAMLKICDSASHEQPEREVTSSELQDGISILEGLYTKHLP